MTGRDPVFREAPDPSEGPVALTLYVSDGASARSRAAAANLGRIADGVTPRPRIEVVDVARRPDVAERERILATPTLVMHDGPRSRRVIGDLSEPAAVLRALGL